MTRLIAGASSALRLAAMVVLMATTVMITLDVASRYLLNSPVPGVLELVSDFAMPLMVFLTAAHCFQTGGLIRIDLLKGRLPIWLERAMNMLAFAISAVIVFLMAFSAARRALRNHALGSMQVGHFEYPTWPIYAVVFAGLALMTLAILTEFRAARDRNYEMPRATQEEVM